ncbi:DUF4212 domain-containing protein [Bordetella petrii]|uniref:DUF4212 domain-containing protein n=1 Tax=Bordetella petrii TaxID=94624 RepID=UPI001E481374|nr:DUF4212 domain-containing protein [Bordetella petrii]MCD0502567.1 DUF4212 domain-containing protein [Bordetella petrii]
MPDTRTPSNPAARRYWRRNLVLIGILLGCWAGLTFLPAFFARDLLFTFIGWPFSFWMAAYGAPLLYLVLVGVYAFIMNRADSRARPDDERGD